MNFAIPEILRHQRHKHVDLLLLPAQSSREQRQAETFEAFETVDLVPAAEFFHEGVLGPAVGRPHEYALLQVYETCLSHHALVPVADVRAHGPAHLSPGFAQQLTPFVDVGAYVRVI